MKWIGKHNVFSDLLIGGVLLSPPDNQYSYELTLPNDDGTSGQVLTTDGNGVLTWVTNSAGGTGVSMTNGVDNRVMTATAAQDITGEANLTFDGAKLDIAGGGTSTHIAGISSSTLNTGYGFYADLNDSLTATHNNIGLYVDYDKSGITATGQTATLQGVKVDINDAATNHASSIILMKGLNACLTAASASGNPVRQYGVYNSLTGGDEQYGIKSYLTGATVGTTYGLWQTVADGGTDVKFLSSADPADYFTIATGAAGATTITTVDDGSHAADLTFNIDGFTKFTSPDTTGGGVEIENASASGAPALLIDNNDADQMALDINADNTTVNIVDITSTTLTTGKALDIDINDSSTAAATNIISNVDYSKTGVTADSTSRQVTGLGVSVNDTATNHSGSTVTKNGCIIQTLSSNSTGTTTNTGLTIQTTGAATNRGLSIFTTDGGEDIRIISSADTADYCTISTGASGATTLTTVDGGAAAANLSFNIDGTFAVSSTGIDIASDGTITNGTWNGAAITVPYGGTGLTTVGTNYLLTGNGTSALSAESGLQYIDSSEKLKVNGTSDVDISSDATSGYDVVNYAYGSMHFNPYNVFGTGVGNIIEMKDFSTGTVSGAAFSIKGGGGYGTNKTGGNIEIVAGRGTGTGTGGSFRFWSSPAGSTGSSYNTSALKFTVDSVGNAIVYGDITVTGGDITLGSTAGEVVSTGQHMLKQTKVTLDQAACNALHGGTVASRTLVAAQGADTIIIPTEIIILVDFNTAQLNNVDNVVSYNGSSNFQYAAKYIRRFMYGETTDMTLQMGGYAGKLYNDITTPINNPLTMTFTGAITTNAFTSMTVYTSYYVIDNS